MRGIDYVVEECPNAVGATQLVYKDALNRLEAASPGTKLAFVKEFVRTAQALFATDADAGVPGECQSCGMPAYGAICSFCSLVARGRDQAGTPRGRGPRRLSRRTAGRSGAARSVLATARRSC